MKHTAMENTERTEQHSTRPRSLRFLCDLRVFLFDKNAMALQERHERHATLKNPDSDVMTFGIERLTERALQPDFQ